MRVSFFDIHVAAIIMSSGSIIFPDFIKSASILPARIAAFISKLRIKAEDKKEITFDSSS